MKYLQHNTIRLFWIPYAVVVVLSIIGVAWSAKQEAKIRANQQLYATIVNHGLAAWTAQCAFDKEIQEPTRGKHVVSLPPFCSKIVDIQTPAPNQ